MAGDTYDNQAEGDRDRESRAPRRDRAQRASRLARLAQARGNSNGDRRQPARDWQRPGA